MIANYTFRRFFKTIIIGFIAITFSISEYRTFYTFSNGKSFTYWNILGITYVIPDKYYGLTPPLFSDYVSGSSFFLLQNFNIQDKIMVSPNNPNLDNNFQFYISNKNNSFSLITEEKFEYYKREIDNYSYNKIYNRIYNKNNTSLDISSKNECNQPNSVEYYKINEPSNNILSYYYKNVNHNNPDCRIYTYMQDNIFIKFSLFFICIFLVILVIYSIMYLGKYSLDSYCNKIHKVLIIDTIEFLIVNSIFLYLLDKIFIFLDKDDDIGFKFMFGFTFYGVIFIILIFTIFYIIKNILVRIFKRQNKN